jgi:hypothetical protein
MRHTIDKHLDVDESTKLSRLDPGAVHESGLILIAIPASVELCPSLACVAIAADSKL